MNRRQFTASLAALFAAPALPLAARVPAAATPAVPAGAYAWAQLIARSQNKCSPDMLAKLLHLKPEVAKVLFKDMVVDGVLRAPGTSGIAKAVQPFETTGLESTATGRLKTRAKDALEKAMTSDAQSEEEHPLVTEGDPGLQSAHISAEDDQHASPDQYPEESPDRG